MVRVVVSVKLPSQCGEMKLTFTSQQRGITIGTVSTLWNVLMKQNLLQGTDSARPIFKKFWTPFPLVYLRDQHDGKHKLIFLLFRFREG